MNLNRVRQLAGIALLEEAKGPYEYGQNSIEKFIKSNGWKEDEAKTEEWVAKIIAKKPMFNKNGAKAYTKSGVQGELFVDYENFNMNLRDGSGNGHSIDWCDQGHKLVNVDAITALIQKGNTDLIKKA